MQFHAKETLLRNHFGKKKFVFQKGLLVALSALGSWLGQATHYDDDESISIVVAVTDEPQCGLYFNKSLKKHDDNQALFFHDVTLISSTEDAVVKDKPNQRWMR